ncbi:MAG: 4-oxalocrotonate tautomerase [Clostridia bacterium]|nr:4-oxalocrotonate tautomerase [Clostridia bacterium]
MPHIAVECGKLSDKQREELIARLTVTAAETMGVPQKFFSVTIRELPDENYGIGGLTIDCLKRDWAEHHSKEDK